MPRKELAKGYTTGTCAQAATKAALALLFRGLDLEEQGRGKEAENRVQVELPGGSRLVLPVEDIQIERDGERELPIQVSCAIRKDSGDDPDVTNGILIYSKVKRSEKPGIVLEGGPGVGRVTKPGLEQPVGSPAINRVPRRMILKEAKDACEKAGYEQGLTIQISIPEGERLAAKTFNPRLGIQGGLSVLGTSGIVEPMSEQALIDTIRLDLKVKRAGGSLYLIAAPGNYGLDFLKDTYGMDPEEAVKCSNYIGQTMDMACELGFQGLVLAGHIGKLIKVAGGIMNTHSKWADCRMELLAAAALRRHLGEEKASQILESLTTEEALGICKEEERAMLGQELADRAEEHLIRRTEGKLELGVILFSSQYGILGKSSQADSLIKKYQEWHQNRQEDL